MLRVLEVLVLRVLPVLLVLMAQDAAPSLPADVAESLRKRVDAGFSRAIVVGIQDVGAAPRYFTFGRAGARPIDERTIFEIGSITKTFTATVLAELAARGELALDDPVQKFVPADVKLPSRSGRAITLEDLATQSSGLPRLPSNLKPADPANPYKEYDKAAMFEFLRGYTLGRDPGSSYEYSNLGFGLLGQVLADRRGGSYENAVRLICDALDLADTRVTLDASQRARLAPGHEGVFDVPNWDFQAIAGAGALRSTTRDLLRFVSAHAGLSPDGGLRGLAATHTPRRPGPTPLMKVGLAWHIRQTSAAPIVWHNGGTGGYHSFAGFVAGRRAVVVLSNTTYNTDDVGFRLLDPSIPLQPVKTVAPVPAATLQRYAGIYHMGLTVTADVRVVDDHLTLQLTGQPRYTLYAESPTQFFLVVVPASVTFTADDAEHASFVLHQNGRDVPARRVRP